jgi:hypothetical protein
MNVEFGNFHDFEVTRHFPYETAYTRDILVKISEAGAS